MKKRTLDYIKSNIENDGYKVLSDIYVSAHDKLILECSNGHRFKLSWQKWVRGRRCKYCNKSRLHFGDIENSFKLEGYTLLTTKTEYRNTKQKLVVICSEGHMYNVSYSNWRRGCRCRTCYVNSLKKPLSEFEQVARLEGFTLLSGRDRYEDASSKLLWRCPKGHSIFLSWNSWRVGVRCKHCAIERMTTKYKLDYDFIKKIFKEEGYKLLSDTYVNAFEKLHYICPNGHDGDIRWNDFQQGYRCGKCSHNVSNAESEISEFLMENGLVVDNNNRELIKPYELDITVPDKKVAIEYCGLYWHSELKGKDKNYHINKLNRCNDIGYRLITIFEDEWCFNKDIVMDRLNNIFGLSGNKIYARKCLVKDIDTKTKNKFLDANHLQGKDSSVVKLGLFFGPKLVSVMTFSAGNIAKGSRAKNSMWELSRFCSVSNLHVVGGASKLFKYFINNYDWELIFSYADRRWSNGDLYIKLGFTFDSFTKMGYWYTDGERRVHRFNFRKQLGGPPKNFYRIWDCGNLKYKFGGMN
jgi:hypothetical protein